MARNRSGNQKGWGIWNLVLALALLPAIASPLISYAAGFARAAAPDSASQAKPGGQFYDVIRLKAEASVAGCCDGACWPPRR